MKQTTFSLLLLIDILPRWYDVVLHVWMVTNRQNNDGGCVWLTNEMKWIQMKLEIRNLNNWKQSKHIFVIFNSFIHVNIQQLSIWKSLNKSFIWQASTTTCLPKVLSSDIFWVCTVCSKSVSMEPLKRIFINKVTKVPVHLVIRLR